MKTRLILCILIFLSLTAFLYKKGDTAYTKRTKTALLETPSVTAKVTGELPWGVKLKVKEVNGRWLRVKGDGKSGWVYAGNVAAGKPPKENKKDFLPSEPGKTTTALAARGLSETSKEYANRKSLDAAAKDVEWMEQKSDSYTRDQVLEYMKSKGKGEYQK